MIFTAADGGRLFFGGWTLAFNGVGLTTAVLQAWGLAAGSRVGHLHHEGDGLLLSTSGSGPTFPRFRFDGSS